MYDGNKIIPGLIVFLAILSFPIVYNVATGETSTGPTLTVGTNETQCVEPVDYMRSSHMTLLDQWRTSVVRDGVRTYVATDGKTYDMSLTNTCLKCHADKAQFCDQCHNYAQVSPNCFDCHQIPEVKK